MLELRHCCLRFEQYSAAQASCPALKFTDVHVDLGVTHSSLLQLLWLSSVGRSHKSWNKLEWVTHRCTWTSMAYNGNIFIFCALSYMIHWCQYIGSCGAAFMNTKEVFSLLSLWKVFREIVSDTEFQRDREGGGCFSLQLLQSVANAS